ncbi:NAD-dependent epimerase/dehydratase family protein [Candidatus Albibeggiatoa sp. nov. NOAA]|uniref:NAD-dependent epimerase/dehydratase family protein n=1 Tax=Candidatus Albibeggiatoa sp. nov. NOAA TaxID=3162724 RepID=UPI0032F27DB6|nr:NAD-dependent epimerase/dehydratase family protein [Thiotrichaceae bacterium]
MSKTILVTGGAGFIGSHLVEKLLKLNYQVKILDNFSTGKLENLALFIEHPNLSIIRGSITCFETVYQAMQNTQYVFHQAALVSVPLSIQQPQQSFQNNIKGTFNIFEAARCCHIEHIVFASSAAVYAESTTPLQESMSTQPASPYALEKLYAEQLAQLYQQLYGISSTGLRYFNVYGERQDPKSPYSGVISIFLDKIRNQQPITIYGDGQQTRDFIYVKDVVQANISAMEKSQNIYHTYNVATGHSITIQKLVQILQKLTNSQEIEINTQAARKGEIYHSYANVEYITDNLNWVPRWSIEKGLHQLIQY